MHWRWWDVTLWFYNNHFVVSWHQSIVFNLSFHYCHPMYISDWFPILSLTTCCTISPILFFSVFINWLLVSTFSLVFLLQYMQVCLDQQLLNAEYGGEIVVSLQSAEMMYSVQSNLVPSSIFWTRDVQEHFVGDDMKVSVKDWTFSGILNLCKYKCVFYLN